MPHPSNIVAKLVADKTAEAKAENAKYAVNAPRQFNSFLEAQDAYDRLAAKAVLRASLDIPNFKTLTEARDAYAALHAEHQALVAKNAETPTPATPPPVAQAPVAVKAPATKLLLISRQAFDALNTRQRAGYIRGGGKIHD